MKKKILIILVALLLTIPVSRVTAYQSDFETKTFNTTIDVNENYTFQIREDIEINGINPIHGIYRYIPVKNYMSFNDRDGNLIRQTEEIVQIKKIKVEGHKFKVSYKNNNKIIRIGDPKVTFTGAKSYSLSYMVKFYDDGLTNFDIFYYNVLPHYWESGIENCKIVVNMPKAFDKDQVVVTAGKAGSESASTKIKYTVEGNKVTIVNTVPLEAGEGITMSIKLPEGYYVKAENNNMLILAISLIAVAISAVLLILWYRFGRRQPIVQTVEFYPPDNFTPADIGYVVDGILDKEDFVSLIIYLAQKGYINIEQKGKKDFVLHKVKGPEKEEKEYIKVLYKDIFKKDNSVNIGDLPEDFDQTYTKVTDQVEGGFDTNTETSIFNENFKPIMGFGIGLVLLGFLAVFFLTNSFLQEDLRTLPVVPILTVVIYFFSLAIGRKATAKKYIQRVGKKFRSNIVSIITLIISIIMTGGWLSSAFDSPLPALTVEIMEISSYIALRYFNGRSKYGVEILGRTLGFRQFIQAADLERLNLLVKENPSYFYNILPYAYVLGLSSKWIEKFENINVSPPSWYYGGNGNVDSSIFRVSSLESIISSMSSSVSHSINISAGDSSGGSGGGGSGGGSGGGGGGSW